MNVSYRRAATLDVVQQFRYYLTVSEVPDIATRFRQAVHNTAELLARNPLIGPRYISDYPVARELRSWPVRGFEVIRIYYSLETDSIDIVRVLHGKRNVRQILKSE